MLFETIIPASGSSFAKKNFIFKHFPSEWHYHPEFELLLITEGTGKRFVGRGVSEFLPGDVIFVGANVPHFHLSDSIYYENNDLYCSSETIQFKENVFPENYRSMPEFLSVGKLMERSVRGVLWRDPEVHIKVQEKLTDFERYTGIERLVELYNLLDYLGAVDKFSYLSVIQIGSNVVKDEQNIPVYRAYQFLCNNFKNNISLDAVASYAGQSASALCRNFKRSTGKSVFECLQEIRIDFSQKLLINSDLNVNQLAYESGFNNISHFNHKFKELSGFSPLDYRSRYQVKKASAAHLENLVGPD